WSRPPARWPGRPTPYLARSTKARPGWPARRPAWRGPGRSAQAKSLSSAPGRRPAAPRPPHPPLFAPSRSLFREEAVQGADDGLGPLHVDSAPRYIRIGTTVNVNALDTAWAY